MGAEGQSRQAANRSEGRNMVFASVTRSQLAAALLMVVSSAHAQGAADFYKGRNIDLYIGYSVGGAYDLYARMVSKHIGKHIPGNPTVIPKNMEGAGSLRLANWLYNVAPKDGSALGIIGRGTGFDPLLGNKAAQFDASKFTWIGSANNEVSICVAWHTSGITKFEDLLTKELVVGGTSASADTDNRQRRARHQDEGRHRLSRRQRGRPRHGARRGAGPLRLVVVERQIYPPEMDRRQAVHHPGPARA
jgi:hypothetical protein